MNLYTVVNKLDEFPFRLRKVVILPRFFLKWREIFIRIGSHAKVVNCLYKVK